MDHDDATARPIRTFLVERYWPGIDERRLREALPKLERAARVMTVEGTPAAHVGSILMPVDQVVFSLIEAADEAAVRTMNDRAEIPLDRIAAAIAFWAGNPMKGDR
jgi:hypothetical protein